MCVWLCLRVEIGKYSTYTEERARAKLWDAKDQREVVCSVAGAKRAGGEQKMGHK